MHYLMIIKSTCIIKKTRVYVKGPLGEKFASKQAKHCRNCSRRGNKASSGACRRFATGYTLKLKIDSILYRQSLRHRKDFGVKKWAENYILFEAFCWFVFITFLDLKKKKTFKITNIFFSHFLKYFFLLFS